MLMRASLGGGAALLDFFFGEQKNIITGKNVQRNLVNTERRQEMETNS